jgi:beta-carotene 15,15'-dioxygenase
LFSQIKQSIGWREFPAELFNFVILALIFKIGGLLWGFAIYFIIWHSIPSLNDQMRFLYGHTNSSSIKAYLWEGLPYWLLSLASISGLYWFFNDQTLFLALFFPFLAAITFPHVGVMLVMFKSGREHL